MRIRALFHAMGAHGHRVEEDWFRSLNTNELFVLLSHVVDMWTFDLAFSVSVRCRVCPPNGILLNGREAIADLYRVCSFSILRRYVLSAMEKMVMSGACVADRALGTQYALGGLTAVHDGAATRLPHIAAMFA